MFSIQSIFYFTSTVVLLAGMISSQHQDKSVTSSLASLAHGRSGENADCNSPNSLIYVPVNQCVDCTGGNQTCCNSLVNVLLCPALDLSEFNLDLLKNLNILIGLIPFSVMAALCNGPFDGSSDSGKTNCATYGNGNGACFLNKAFLEGLLNTCNSKLVPIVSPDTDNSDAKSCAKTYAENNGQNKAACCAKVTNSQGQRGGSEPSKDPSQNDGVKCSHKETCEASNTGTNNSVATNYCCQVGCVNGPSQQQPKPKTLLPVPLPI